MQETRGWYSMAHCRGRITGTAAGSVWRFASTSWVRCGMRRWNGSTLRCRISGRRGICGERRACFRGCSMAASRGRGYGLAVKIDAACDNRGIVPTVVKPFRTFVFALTLVAPGFVLGCHAQTPAEAGAKLSPDLARRVEVL